MSRGPLEVLRQLRATYEGRGRFFPPVGEVDEAIAQVEALIAALQTIAKLNSNDYTDGGIRSMKRTASDALAPFTPGQDSQGGGNG